MGEMHEGGCACGSVRYRVTGQPAAVIACHCKFCQKQLGTAFRTTAWFDLGSVEFTKGRLTVYEHRSDESGRWVKMEFCGRCGSTVTHTAEVRPGMRALAIGTFDDPSWVRLERHIWTRSKRPWIALPPDVASFPEGSPTPPTPPRPG
jgi:hypothetical protein